MKKLLMTAMGLLLITAGFTCSKNEEAAQDEAPAAVEETAPSDQGDAMPMDEGGSEMAAPADEGAQDEAAPEEGGEESGH